MAVRAGEDRRVGAVIVHHEAPEDLVRCLAALHGGETAPDRVVVVDNSETAAGRAGAVAATTGAGVERIDVGANIGFAAGSNRGAAALDDVDALFFVNQDAEVDRSALTRLVAGLVDHPDRGAVSPLILTGQGRVWFAGGSYQPALARLGRPAFGHPASELDARSGAGSARGTDWLNGCALLVRSEAWAALGGFDERYFLYWEDVDLSLRLADAGWSVAVDLEAEVVHHRDPLGDGLRTLTPTAVEHAIRSRLLFVRHRLGWRHQLTAGPYTLVNAVRLLTLAARHPGHGTVTYLRAAAAGLGRGMTD